MAETRTFDEAVPGGSGWADRFASSSESLLGRNWGWIVARGVLLIALGVLAFLAPGAALLGFTMVFAAFSFVDGIFSVASGVRGARDKRERMARGMPAFRGPGAALLGFTIVLAAYSFVDGILSVASGVRGARDKRERWGAVLLSGLFGIGIGVLFVLFPLISTFDFAVTAVI